ncbi:50S ribosomal protein L31e [Candidatus Woesearchaeota archaeon]|nr:50S ribosomal protein L31e [Candidatus Woesearchaeota archaeon]
MATLERTYNIPLRKEFMKAPKYKRTNKAVIAVREFLARHMKSDTIILGSYLNSKLWERGIKKPPHHVKVNVVKDDKGVVTGEGRKGKGGKGASQQGR